MLFSFHPKQMALMAVLSACVATSGAWASGKQFLAQSNEDEPEEPKTLPLGNEDEPEEPKTKANISVWEGEGPSPLASQIQNQLAVLDQTATPETIEKAKQAEFVAVICKDHDSLTDIPESLKETLSWSNLLVLEGGIKHTDFETLSTGLRTLSLKPHTIWSDEAMALLQTWLERTTHLESLNLPYCLVEPTIYGVSQSATEQKATEAAAFVSHLPLTLRHLNLSGTKNMGGHEIVNSLLRALSQSRVSLTSLNLKGRLVINPDALPSSLTSLTMNVPFSMSAEAIEPLQLPQGLKQLCLVSDQTHKVEDIIKYIPSSNNIETLNIGISYADDLIKLFDILEKSTSFSQVKSLGLELGILKDEDVEKALAKLVGTQLVSVDLRQCLSLSQEYKDKLRSSPFCNRMGEKVEIKL